MTTKLFWMRNYRNHWIAFSEATGLVAFPAELNGWQKRRPTHVAAKELREVSLRLAAFTGMPGSMGDRRGKAVR